MSRATRRSWRGAPRPQGVRDGQRSRPHPLPSSTRAQADWAGDPRRGRRPRCRSRWSANGDIARAWPRLGAMLARVRCRRGDDRPCRLWSAVPGWWVACRARRWPPAADPGTAAARASSRRDRRSRSLRDPAFGHLWSRAWGVRHAQQTRWRATLPSSGHHGRQRSSAIAQRAVHGRTDPGHRHRRPRTASTTRRCRWRYGSMNSARFAWQAQIQVGPAQ